MTLHEARAVLGLSPEAKPDDIKRTYRRLAARWHPDRRTPGSAAYFTAEARLKEINLAYERLCTTTGQGDSHRPTVNSTMVRTNPLSKSAPRSQERARSRSRQQSRGSESRESGQQANTGAPQEAPCKAPPPTPFPQGWTGVVATAGAVGVFCAGVLWSASLASMLAWTASWIVLAVGALSLSAKPAS